jgi:hypothetical protein
MVRFVKANRCVRPLETLKTRDENNQEHQVSDFLVKMIKLSYRYKNQWYVGATLVVALFEINYIKIYTLLHIR